MNQNTKFQTQSFCNYPMEYLGRQNPSRANMGPFTVAVGQQDRRQSFSRVEKLSRWSNQQKQRYSIFICYFRQILCEGASSYNTWNMFKGMSKFIRSRNAQQCRSYHLKLLKQFHAISTFISIVAKRLPSLRDKIIAAEDQLNNIQLEFNLFIEEQKQQHQSFNYTLLNEKESGKQLPKTSDTYVQEPNPMSQCYHNFNYQDFGSLNNSKVSFQSSFKSFQHQPAKASLPSFAQDQGQQEIVQQKIVKLETKEVMRSSFDNCGQIIEGNGWTHSDKSEEQYEKNETDKKNSQEFQQNPKLYNTQGQNYKKNSQFPNLSQSKGLQKMKEILECHYLFQLWTSKLEKIMRG